MGSYNSVVITTLGQQMLTDVIGTHGSITFSKFQTSSHVYPAGTDLTARTSLQDVKQTVTPSVASKNKSSSPAHPSGAFLTYIVNA